VTLNACIHARSREELQARKWDGCRLYLLKPEQERSGKGRLRRSGVGVHEQNAYRRAADS
jgi:hypothetical protein